MAIPRANISLSNGEIFRFIVATLLPANRGTDETLVRRFERKFAARYGPEYTGIVCCKARVAFYHLLRSLDLTPGGEVMISAIHVADFVNMIRLAGFNPVVVDIEANGYAISARDLKGKITGNTAAILVTHLSGFATDMNLICAIAAEKGIPVLEDCSQAVRASCGGRPMGTFGIAAIFSLSLLKSVCTLSGGMIVTRNQGLAEKLKQRIHPLPPPARLQLLAEAMKNIIIKMLLTRAVFSTLVCPVLRILSGFGDLFSKYQKTNRSTFLRETMPADFMTSFSGAQANLGLSRLANLDERENTRTAFAGRLRGQLLRCHPEILPTVTPSADNGYWLFPLLPTDPDAVKKAIRRKGIDSSRMLLSVLSRENAFKGFDFACPNAESVHARTLFVPMYAGLRKDDPERIAAAVCAAVGSGDKQ